MIKKAIITALSVALIFSISTDVYADGINYVNYKSVQAEAVTKDNAMNNVTAKSAFVYEMSTGTVISEKNSTEKLTASHFAKLMTLLCAEERIDSGKLKLRDKVTVSANANSKGAPQIWLDVGEQISVDELIKSITVGNANDACAALAEKIGGTEQGFVQLMNKKAKDLGMVNTVFKDSTGISKDTVTTAYDLALLSSEILKHNAFITYYTTWMINVRGNAVELVSTNRLIRTYKGITGLKSCGSNDTGTSLIATAKRGDMSLCVVLLGCMDEDKKFAEAKELLNYAFENYEIYHPEVEKKAIEKVKIKGGEKLKAKVKIGNYKNIVIPKGTYSQIVSEIKRKYIINAPAEIGSIIGKITYKDGDGKEILESKIVLDEKIDKNSLWFSYKRILLNLFKM
ncbi:MAG: D-alanyl-D-alanine carboxypeptidase [Ruminococcus sp.]|nr:D-alanyl-D-alanine carboxypeptidase [Ruminococcus sp.]